MCAFGSDDRSGCGEVGVWRSGGCGEVGQGQRPRKWRRCSTRICGTFTFTDCAMLRASALCVVLRSQAAQLLQQSTVLDTERGRLTAGAREFLGEDGQYSPQTLQPVEQVLAVDRTACGAWVGGRSGPVVLRSRRSLVRVWRELRRWHARCLRFASHRMHIVALTLGSVIRGIPRNGPVISTEQ